MTYKRGLESAWVEKDGFSFLCDCATVTHVQTVVEGPDGKLVPTPMEFAVTCDGCGTSHWFSLLAAHDQEPHDG